MSIIYYSNDGGSSEYTDYSGQDAILGPEDCGFSAPAGYEFACWSTGSTLNNNFQVPQGYDNGHYLLRTDTTGSATYYTITELYAIWIKTGTVVDTDLCASSWSNYTKTTSATLIFNVGSASGPTTWTNNTGGEIKITSVTTPLGTGNGHFVNSSTGQYADGTGHKITTRMQLVSSNSNTYNCDYDVPIGLSINADGTDYSGDTTLYREYNLVYTFENTTAIIPAGGTLTIKLDKSVAPDVASGQTGWVLCSGRMMQDPPANRTAKITYSPALANTVWRYDGTTWVKDRTIKYWNGTTWEDKEVNYY